MHTFSICHISDLHFGTRPNQFGIFDNLQNLFTASDWSFFASHDSTKAEIFSQWLYRNQRQLDAVLITGDLATTGSQSDLKNAHAFVDNNAANRWLGTNGNPTLRIAQDNQARAVPEIFLIPGNHDRYQDDRLRSPGCINFDNIFKQYWPAKWSAHRLALLTDPGNSRDRLMIIGADLSLQNAKQATAILGRYGQGFAEQGTIDELVRLTCAAHSQLTAVAWAVHFPPNFQGIKDNLRLVDEHMLVTAAQTAGVSHLFCGHTHQTRIYRISTQGTQVVHCAPSLCQVNKNNQNGFLLHRITVSNGTICKVRSFAYSWDTKNSAFEVRQAFSASRGKVRAKQMKRHI